MSRMTMSAAIARAQREEMLRDPAVYIMGLDVGPHGERSLYERLGNSGASGRARYAHRGGRIRGRGGRLRHDGDASHR